MPGSMIYGLLLGHHDLRGIHADDYSLNDHEREVEEHEPQHEAAALESQVSTSSRAGADGGGTVVELAGVEGVSEIREPSKVAAALSALSAAPTLVSAPSLGPLPSRKQSASMLSGPAAGRGPPRTGTFMSSTMIYITSCFGCSCLAMPWAYAQCGWALAIVLMFATAAVTQWGANILLECAVKVAGDPSGGVSIKEIARVASPRLTALPEIVVIINCWGSGMGALVVAGFLLPRTFQELSSLQHHLGQPLANMRVWDELMKERVLWISIILAVALPFCFLRDITPLKAAGIVSVLAVSFMAAVTAAAYALPTQLDTCELYGKSLTCPVGVVPVSSSIKDIFGAIPVFFFNYSSNYQLLVVHNALKHKSPRTTSLAVAASLGFTSVAYLVMGLCTYFTFGTNTMANVLGSYGNALAIDLCRLAVIASVTLLFPLTVFTSRISVMSILGKDFVRRHNPKRVFLLVTVALVAFNWLVAVSVSSINVILGISGALSTVPIALLLPGSYLAALAAPGPAGRSDRIKGRVAMWAGVVLTAICLYGSLAAGSN